MDCDATSHSSLVPHLSLSLSLETRDCRLLTLSQGSFEKAKSWVRELQRQADPSTIIMLVGNKLDMEGSRKTPRELGETFAQEEGLLFTEASAKSGDGVEELFMEIGTYHPTSPSLYQTSLSLHMDTGPRPNQFTDHGRRSGTGIVGSR